MPRLPVAGGSDALTSASRLLSPEEIAVRAGSETAFLRLPAPATLFSERAIRLRQRAAGHPMRDYLLFAAEVAEAQHRTVAHYPEVALPDSAAIDAAESRIEPPLPVSTWRRDPAWQTGLHALLDTLAERLPAGAPAAAVVARLRATDAAEVERQADRLLAAIPVGLDVATAPLIGAGLQLYWSTLVDRTARTLGERAFGRTGTATRCPCCASPPTASVLRIGGDESGTRSLHCSLCSAQWHYVRIKCAHCESTKGIHYQTLEGRTEASAAGGAPAGRGPAVKAECCDTCKHYLKIVQMDVDAEVEPVADDLATLPLDLLLSESGYAPAGVNLLIVFGDPGGD